MDDAFVELKALNSLNISVNYLQSISSKIFNGISGLSELDLSGNRFNVLQKDTFTELKDLAFLTLTKNGLKNVSFHKICWHHNDLYFSFPALSLWSRRNSSNWI